MEYLHDLFEDSETLAVFTQNFCAKDIYSVFTEYASIRRESTVDLQKIYEDHLELNRYTDIPCFESSRVIVK